MGVGHSSTEQAAFELDAEGGVGVHKAREQQGESMEYMACFEISK